VAPQRLKAANGWDGAIAEATGNREGRYVLAKPGAELHRITARRVGPNPQVEVEGALWTRGQRVDN